jgi:flagellar hook-associated protein 1 FlgK
MAEHYKGLVFDVGNGVRSSVDAAQVHQVLSDQADVRRMSLSGVSIDEELVKLIEFQAAYQASAKVVSAADEMLRTLISL